MMGSDTKQKKNFNLRRLIFPDYVVHVRRWQLVLVLIVLIVPTQNISAQIWFYEECLIFCRHEKWNEKKKQKNPQNTDNKLNSGALNTLELSDSKTNKTHSDRTETEFQEVHPTAWHVSSFLPKREKQSVAVLQRTLCWMYRSTVQSTFESESRQLFYCYTGHGHTSTLDWHWRKQCCHWFSNRDYRISMWW